MDPPTGAPASSINRSEQPSTGEEAVEEFITRKAQTSVAETELQGSLHSHSIVPGGFDVMSYVTRLMPSTSLIIRLLIDSNTS